MDEDTAASQRSDTEVAAAADRLAIFTADDRAGAAGDLPGHGDHHHTLGPVYRQLTSGFRAPQLVVDGAGLGDFEDCA